MANIEILLTSEAFVKSVLAISDNLAGKYLRPSIREAQDIGLREIIGTALLSKLKALVADGSIDQPENAAYKALVEAVQYYLAYEAGAIVTTKVSYKVANVGVAKTHDENVEVATKAEIDNVRFEYQASADHCCLEVQTFVLENRASYPELGEAQCSRLSSSLRSAATSGLWLGGPRGRRLPGVPVKRNTFLK